MITEKKILDTINKYNMLPAGSHVLVGFSGGADSCCLLHFLNAHKRQLGITLEAAHINHGIRGVEAEGDEGFCVDFCKGIDVYIHVIKANVIEEAKKHKITVEEAGRKVRYERFNHLCKGGLIAVGHNKNDDAETMVMRFFRGTGIKGLCGIPTVSGNVIRPLLELTRREIETYCGEKGIAYRTDSTNQSNDYTRNKIRNQYLMDISTDLNPNIIETLNGMKRILTDEEAFLEEAAQAAYRDCATVLGETVIIGQSFKELHVSLQRRVLRLAFERVCGLSRVVSRHIDAGITLYYNEAGRQLSLPGNVIMERTYEGLQIYEKKGEQSASKWEKQVSPGETVSINGFCIKLSQINEEISPNFHEKAYTLTVNYDRIECPFLSFRNRRDGDIIFLEKVGTKKLKNYFIDKKIERQKREQMPLLCDGSRIILMGDGVINKKYEAKRGDKRIIHVTLWEE